MPVIPLTVVTGLCLVLTFIVFFLRLHHAGRLSSVERDSLLPFADEGRHEVSDDPPGLADDFAVTPSPRQRRTWRAPRIY